MKPISKLTVQPLYLCTVDLILIDNTPLNFLNTCVNLYQGNMVKQPLSTSLNCMRLLLTKNLKLRPLLDSARVSTVRDFTSTITDTNFRTEWVKPNMLHCTTIATFFEKWLPIGCSFQPHTHLTPIGSPPKQPIFSKSHRSPNFRTTSGISNATNSM